MTILTTQYDTDMTGWTLTTIATGNVTAVSATNLTIVNGPISYTFTGTGLTWTGTVAGNNVQITGGNFTGVQVTEAGLTNLSITGLSVSATQIMGYIQANNVSAFQATVFAGNDTFNGSNLKDVFLGLEGNDTFNGGGGDDTLNGGNGSDTASYAGASSGVTINLNNAVQVASGGIGADTLISIENLIGSAFNDTLNGNSGDNTINGGDGDDAITLAAGGTDTGIGGNGNDTFTFDNTFTAADSVDGGAGNDTLSLKGNAYASAITLGATTLLNVESIVLGMGTFLDQTNGTTQNTGNYSFITHNATVAAGQSLAVNAGALAGGTFLTFNGSAETDGSFVLTGGSGNDVLTGGAQNDTFNLGVGGNDTAFGGNGNDTFNMGNALNAADRIDGGAGTNTLFINSTAAAVMAPVVFSDTTVTNIRQINVNTLATNAINITYAEGTIATGAAMTFFGVGVAAALTVDASAETGGFTSLIGGTGNDTFIGGRGDGYYDLVNWTDGGAFINGGAGNDTMTGHFGNDHVSYYDYAGNLSGVTVSLALQGQAQNTGGQGIDTFSGFRILGGSQYADTLTGDDNDNVLISNGIASGTGTDTIYGGGGNDIIHVFNNSHVVDGGSGVDTITYSGKGNGAGAVVTAGVTVSLAITGVQATGIGNLQVINVENLAGSVENDLLTGDNGANTLYGSAGKDQLFGGAGNDILYGDAGIDYNALFDYARLFDNSTYNPVTGFFLAVNADSLAAGDNDDILDGGDGLDTAAYVYARSNYTITRNADNSVTVSGAEGTDTLRNIERIQFADQTVILPKASADLSGDGKSDLLWRSSSYAYSEWVMNGGAKTEVALGTVGAGWRFEGTADFNADGKSEALWRNTSNGQLSVEAIAGSSFSGLGSPGSKDTSFTVAALGDFNGDGKADIIWKNGANVYSEWIMDGSVKSSEVALGTSGWTLEGSGDFNGDGKTDLLWRNPGNAQLSIETIVGSSFTGLGGGTGSQDIGTKVAAIGDFNGDGKADIIWKNGSNAYTLWLMNGATKSSEVALGTSGWVLEGSGDYNGDGKADVVWRNPGSNQLSVETIVGSTFIGLGSPGTLDASYKLVSRSNVLSSEGASFAKATADFNGDGKSDLIWRSSSHAYSEWVMDGSTKSSEVALGTVSANWKAEGAGDFNGDGKADMLWRSVGGTISIETLNGSSFTGLGSTGSQDSSFTVAAIGDFNGDGKSDILWRSNTNAYSVWTMDGATKSSETALGTSGWTLGGSGDFNGDGKTDLLWRNGGNGAISVETITGGSFSGLGATGSQDISTKVAAIGDFNGDGKADIIWKSSGNAYSLWLMDGATKSSEVALGTSGWTLEASGDYNGDGKADLVWRNDGNGAISVETVSGSSFIVLGASPGSLDTSFKIVSQTNVLAAGS